MELLNDAAHRALLFVDLLEKNGAPPTPDKVDEMGGAGHLLWGKDVLGYEWWSEEDRETYPDYLSRIGLVTVVDQVVRTTAQGRAILHHLSSAGAQDELIEMVIDPTDPFAYSKVLTRLAAFGPSMLIDPYCRHEQIWDILGFDGITRVLTGPERSSRNMHASIASALHKLGTDRRIEVRWSAETHDRYLIPKSGNVVMLGMSLNGAGRKIGTIASLSSSASQVLRQQHEELWRASTPIPPRGGQPSPEVSES